MLFAKRMHIEYPDKIRVGDIEYKAVYEMGKLLQKAYIEARNIKSNEIIWKKKIYQIIINPLMEHDIQWVMITNLKKYGMKLLIYDEKERSFILDLDSLNVKKIRTRLSKVKILDKNFKEIKILKSADELEQFTLAWEQKEKLENKHIHTIYRIAGWDYKIDLIDLKAKTSDRWLYNEKGYCRILSKQKRPIYQIKEVEKFNNLILKP